MKGPNVNGNKRIVKTLSALILALTTCFSLHGTSINASATTAIGKVNISMIGKYDSADTATVKVVDTVNKTIKLRNHALGKDYTLNYDNTSMMYDAYGSAMSASLLERGQIVDVTFLKSSKMIATLNVNKDAWYIDSTRDHDLVRNDGTAVVKGSVYKIDPRTMIIAEDKPALVEDVLSTDSVAVSGVGKEIYSVVVTGGHGYVSLSSDVVENQSLVGAWLELDNAVIHKISPNMLLSAPEGDYNLQIIGNGANYQSKVNISRNQETVIDTSNVTIAKPKEGLITFEIVPETADVFVDGTRMLTGVPQTVLYGDHNLKIMADGYETQTKYLKVGTPKSVISIELEKIEEEESDSSGDASSEASTVKTDRVDVASSAESTGPKDISSETVDVSKLGSSQTVSGNSSDSSSSSSSSSSESAKNKVIDGYKIYIDEPNGAEVYFDGNYIGIVPTNVTKVSGNHEVIVKKDGYETKSYRIHIDAEETDLSYKFPELVKVKKEEPAADNSGSSNQPSNSNTVSGNSAGDASNDASTGNSNDPGDGSTQASTGASDSSEDASSDATSGTSDSAAGGSSEESGSSNDSSSEASSEETGGSNDSSSEASSDEGGDDAGGGASSGENNEEASDAAATASASS